MDVYTEAKKFGEKFNEFMNTKEQRIKSLNNDSETIKMFIDFAYDPKNRYINKFNMRIKLKEFEKIILESIENETI